MVLAKRLQHLREAAGIPREQAARALRVTPATIHRIEHAEVSLKIPYVRELLRLYGITESSEIEEFLHLCEDANNSGYWQRFHDLLPSWFAPFPILEGEAQVIYSYEPYFVPGLLQTADYARAVIRTGHPSATVRDVERHVDLRIERQRRLVRENPPTLWVVMDEAVLHRTIGGPAVMRAQIGWLIEACSLPHVCLQIVPFTSGPHLGADSAFHMFRFPQSHLPDIVYAENLVGVTYMDNQHDVAVFREALDRMCVQASDAVLTARILENARKWF
ncbi:transcriptional regulator with XRE-family HTH domain [Streptomyces aurantiacus]|uniref:helix-turn-helix domain-containing protein n=1 Tax=Streptomyces aurantiacus TaxID=47760 RepID=UPI002790B3A9|nr:helix-turn-helix transcriptional regulator [Streptomyces aurantiacus]MDQ0778357.1 transcriptional regulator with XRE-family HTH domain [Streptomyces aurantiacus]